MLFLLGHTALLGIGPLETDKEWAQLHICLAEGRNQLSTLRRTASSSQPDQRLRGQTRIYLFLPPQALGGGGGSLTRHAHPTTTREGLLHPILPRGMQGAL